MSLPPRRDRPRKRATSGSRGSDTGAFYREWLKRPFQVAALSPSSPQLVAAVAAAVGEAGRVIELGGGTGAVTEALAARGGRELLVVECVPSFAARLRRRFPRATVVEGDALDAVRLVTESGRFAPGEAEVVVCGLGMLTRGRDEQRALLAVIFELLEPDGYAVQYSYSPRFPAARGLLAELGLEARRTAMAMLNLPPATVFTVRRRR